MSFRGKWFLLPILLSFFALHPSWASPVSVQPQKDVLYKNVVQVADGSTLVFDNSFSAGQFKDGLHAADGEIADYILWNPDPYNRPLLMGDGGPEGRQASLTWKFAAPKGKVFKAGKVSFRGQVFRNGSRATLQAHSQYSNNANGIGGFLGEGGETYGTDAHTVATALTLSTWEVPIPVGTNEFYVTLCENDPYSFVYGTDMRVEGAVTELGIPAIARALVSVDFKQGKYPPGWIGEGNSPWEKYDFYGGRPVHSDEPNGQGPKHLALRMGNSRRWSLYTREEVPVQEGQQWVFQAVISSRNLGWLKPGSHYMVLYAHGDQGSPAPGGLWTISNHGTWTLVSHTYTVPAGVTRLQPGFEGSGGGSLFVHAASFSSAGQTPPLSVPSAAIPSLGSIDISSEIGGDQYRLHQPGENILWKIAPDATLQKSFNFEVRDGKGSTCLQGQVATGSAFYFSPVGKPCAQRGYYELRVNEVVSGIGTVKIKAGAALLGSISTWTDAGNAFGIPSPAQDPRSFLQRTGISWTRPLYRNLAGGAGLPALETPADEATYRNAVIARINSDVASEEGVARPWLANAIEVWNEPASELGDAWDMTKFRKFVRVTKEGVVASQRPELKVAVNLQNLEQFTTFNSGFGSYYDVATLHPYTPGGMHFHSTESAENAGLMADWQAHRTALGKPLWSTEFGWSTYADDCRPVYSVTEATQAQWVVRSALLQLSQGFARVMPFNASDIVEWGPGYGSFGLMRADETPKPALIAYAALAQSVDNLPFTGRLDFGDPKIAAMVFSDPSVPRTVIAFWTPDHDEYTYSLRLPLGPKKKIDLYGDPENFGGPPGEGEEWKTVTISRSVTYLLFNSEQAPVINKIQRPFIGGPADPGLLSGVSDAPTPTDGVPVCSQ